MCGLLQQNMSGMLSWIFMLLMNSAEPSLASNLLTNGGFESENGANPLAWAASVSGSAVAHYTTSGIAGRDVWNGTHAISISQPGSNGDRWFVPSANVPAVVAGEVYEFSVCVRTAQF